MIQCGRLTFLPPVENGIVILGVPVGTAEFCRAHADERVGVEQNFLEWLPKIALFGHFQVAWLLLVFCGVPRANHLLRGMPPSLNEGYAAAHDITLKSTLETLLQVDAASTDSNELARIYAYASIPARMGGLGLRSASRTRHAAYWAAWADAIPVMQKKNPEFAHRIVTALTDSSHNDQILNQLPPALKELESTRRFLADRGFEKCPTWQEISTGAEVPENRDREAGEWAHGWQFHASEAVEKNFVQCGILPNMSTPQRTMLLSQSGPNTSRFLTALPTTPETTFRPGLMEVAIRMLGGI